MKTITKAVLVLILIATVSNISAQINIECEESVYVGDDFSVTIIKDGIPVAGTAVVFTSQRGDESYGITDAEGMVSYISYATGTLNIKVTDGMSTVEKTITVVDEPWVPNTDSVILDISNPTPTPTPVSIHTPIPTVTSTPTEEVNVSVTPGSIVTIPTVIINVTVNDTVNSTEDIVPRQTIEPIVPKPEPTIVETEVYRPPLPKRPETSGLPGFEAIFTIAGILGIVYLMKR